MSLRLADATGLLKGLETQLTEQLKASAQVQPGPLTARIRE